MPSALPLIRIVRHGETEWSLSGWTALALSAQGEMQARALQNRLLEDFRIKT